MPAKADSRIARYFVADQPKFRKLWIAQSISVLGSQVTLVAFPLTALYALHADAKEVGILSALETVPFLLFGAFAGVLIDRWRSRRVLVLMDWIRAVALGLIPTLWLSHGLNINWLYGVAFVVGACTVFFDIAYQSALTSLVRPTDLLTANRWLEASGSLASVSGPGVAAVLLKVLSAPITIAVDAASFAISALFLHSIRSPEAKPVVAHDASIWQDFKAGLRYIFDTSLLRWNVAIIAMWNLLKSGLLAIFFVYLARELKLSSASAALLVVFGSVGSFLGVAAVARITRWVGLGWCILLSMCAGSVGGVLLAVAGRPRWLAIALVATGFGLISAAEPLFNINAISIRQMITPANLMGRTTGSMRFMVWGTLPVGALIAGFMGDAIGARTTMTVIGLGFVIPAVLALISPFRQVRTISDLAVRDDFQLERED
ncbi:MFS transporter [Actinoplanes sp. N902-109]|uniref:MFS transporter n=1 Tax=Actinoplanes sp. (strain N902-109) TaxID=649831 RepID=UPI0003294D08|nr:MFS transporter [Actinoplanes sp. N902-109]AGL16171.1 major facilitator transporter [Actinoplanes sp. N902-109]